MNAGIVQHHNHMEAPSGEIAYQGCPWCEPLIEELARRYGTLVDATIEPEFETTDRGFKRLKPVPGLNYGHVRVYESSNAMHPCIWMATKEPDDLNQVPARPEDPHHEAHIQLTIENAATLRDQLDWIIRNHYQGT